MLQYEWIHRALNRREQTLVRLASDSAARAEFFFILVMLLQPRDQCLVVSDIETRAQDGQVHWLWDGHDDVSFMVELHLHFVRRVAGLVDNPSRCRRTWLCRG